MSASDRSKRRWPHKERRRGGDRRTSRDRRTAAAKAAAVIGAENRRRTARRTTGERRDDRGWEAVSLDGMEGDVTRADQELLTAARSAREFAHAHFSHFKVGAALETVSGAIVTGCNIENASYGLTVCAERVALLKALSEGHTTFTRIAIVADSESPTSPCGACRQLLWEYCGDIDVVLGDLQTRTAQHRLAALLPLPFDRRFML